MKSLRICFLQNYGVGSHIGREVWGDQMIFSLFYRFFKAKATDNLRKKCEKNRGKELTNLVRDI